jgi:mRNA interferase MazF
MRMKHGSKQRLPTGKPRVREFRSLSRYRNPQDSTTGTAFNQRSKVTVLPITSAVPNEHLRPIVLPVIPSTLNGLTTNSFIVCVDPMTFDKRRLVRCLGQLELQQIQEIQLILARYLELEE